MSYLDIAIEILKIIENEGYQAYIIGGAVRDYLLNIDINDVDITTNIPFEQLRQHFKVWENGLAYQSVTIEYKNCFFEITQFRKEYSYLDHRHPVVEKTAMFDEDVTRRDFTINAIAMDKNKNIIDKVNGIEDLKQKRIRCIGQPEVRFQEDALRILRALYFASKLNFKIDEPTLQAMVLKKKLLSYLSNERIYSYFTRILYAEYDLGIEYINHYDLWKDIPVYKKWLSVVCKNYKIEDLPIYYYLRYNEFPPLTLTALKKQGLSAKSLIDSNFSSFGLYKNQQNIEKLMDIFFNLGYDIIEIRGRLNQLKIKNDKELAISKKEISQIFEGKKISIAIDEVIRAILEGRIDNNEKSIKLFLQGLDVVEC